MVYLVIGGWIDRVVMTLEYLVGTVLVGILCWCWKLWVLTVVVLMMADVDGRW